MPASIQMNTRIDPKLKERGDVALAEIGLTPSQAVRALWVKASKRGKDLAELAQLLVGTEEQDGPVGSNPIENGWAAMDAAMISLGIDPARSLVLSDDDLLEEHWAEREHERGLA